MKKLCTKAALVPVNEVGVDMFESMSKDDIAPISYAHFCQSLGRMKPSVDQSKLAAYTEWNEKFGSNAELRSSFILQIRWKLYCWHFLFNLRAVIIHKEGDAIEMSCFNSDFRNVVLITNV